MPYYLRPRADRINWVLEVTLRTHSFVFARLYWLQKRMPDGVPGTFAFPFGRVHFMDASSLFTMYSEIFVDRSYEATNLPDAPYIIDCGGNIGLATIWFKQRYPKATIAVFEADPVIADVLEENVRMLGLKSVEVVHGKRKRGTRHLCLRRISHGACQQRSGAYDQLRALVRVD